MPDRSSWPWSPRVRLGIAQANPCSDVGRGSSVLANNKAVEGVKDATKDEDIVRRIWFNLDWDPMRPSGISSTDEEKDASVARASECRDWLRADFGFPDPVFGDSGNGAGQLYAIDLPNDPTSLHLVQAAMAAIAARFSAVAVCDFRVRG